jgi:hypothetical protein
MLCAWTNFINNNKCSGLGDRRPGGVFEAAFHRHTLAFSAIWRF